MANFLPSFTQTALCRLAALNLLTVLIENKNLGNEISRLLGRGLATGAY